MKPSPQPFFHAFTIKHNDLRARITTPIMVFPAFDPNQSVSPPNGIEVSALWDTGATQSVITAATARDLDLPVVGQVTINHAGGSGLSPLYLVNFLLPNKVGFSGITVSECANIAGDFRAIIGMDIISRGDLAITNCHGKTVMSFRTPAIEMIDYVQDANRLNFIGVPRNAPCPCGKKDDRGKPLKFKHCHGKTSDTP